MLICCALKSVQEKEAKKWDDVRFGERTITLKAQRSCIQSFKKLVERLEKQLFEILYTQTRDFHLAQDFMRETFVKVHVKVENYNSMYPFCNWLFTIGIGLAISNHKKQSVNPRFAI